MKDAADDYRKKMFKGQIYSAKNTRISIQLYGRSLKKQELEAIV